MWLNWGDEETRRDEVQSETSSSVCPAAHCDEEATSFFFKVTPSGRSRNDGSIGRSVKDLKFVVFGSIRSINHAEMTLTAVTMVTTSTP